MDESILEIYRKYEGKKEYDPETVEQGFACVCFFIEVPVDYGHGVRP